MNNELPTGRPKMKADKGQQSDKGHLTSLRSSQGNHTPGPWRVLGEHGIAIWAGDEILVGGTRLNAGNARANARRIVACVNYCEGVQTLEVESAPPHLQLRDLLSLIDNDVPRHNAGVDALKALNAELVEALANAIAHGHKDTYAHPGVGRHEPYLMTPPEWVTKARAALAKVQI